MNEQKIPVIVGQGEISDHPATPQQSLEPLALMAEALKRAEADTGAQLIHAIDSLDIVNLMSWRYSDPATQLPKLLGIAPKRSFYGPVGGESPIRYLQEAAQRIARGESTVAAVCGGEAQNSVNKAERAKVDLPWTPFAHDAPPIVRHSTYQHPMAHALNVVRPITIYPFYDAASAAHYGQTPREALAESGSLWAKFSDEASRNPNAWLKHRFKADDITTPTADNRLIAWPYTKLMVANPAVNQGAALIVTSLAKARELGIPDSKLVYFWGGSDAVEPIDYLKRDQFYQSHAQNAVLGAAVKVAGGDGKAFDAIELYSCFPCVPKMARRTLGLGEDVKPTVTGGLTFFGAPLNDYMTHAACAMVRALRDGKQLGLLYGQGGYVTKHHALVLSPNAPPHTLAQDTNVQAETDRNRGTVPEMNPEASGDGTVESFTVIYGRKGEVEHGVAILRDRDGKRTLGRIMADDRATLAHLTNPDRSPVGSRGIITRADDGLLNWRIA